MARQPCAVRVAELNTVVGWLPFSHIKRGVDEQSDIRYLYISRSIIDFAGMMELFGKYNVEFVSSARCIVHGKA
jgi:hypothetical protein